MELIRIFAILVPAVFLLRFLTQKLNIFSAIDKYDVSSRGIVIDSKQYEGLIGRLSYYPLVEYTYNGKTYREYSTIPDVPLPKNKYFEVGAEIRIYINSKNPSEFSAKYIRGMGGNTEPGQV